METATALLARQAERLGIVTEDGDPLTILLERVKRIRPTADLELIEHAYHFADWAHSGQTRLSGEPYITHPWNVALIVADMGLDDPASLRRSFTMSLRTPKLRWRRLSKSSVKKWLGWLKE